MNTHGFGYEIDFLPVGDGERSGDAIAVRYGHPRIGYHVLIVDGGTKESGAALVDLIRHHYQTDYVDFVINTHPDADHASGLTVVLESLRVGELWMHQPWDHSLEMLHLFHSGRLTTSGLRRRTREALGAAWELTKLAKRLNVPIREPFQGEQIGAFHVLSPTRDWYQALVAQFRNTPAPSPLANTGLGVGLLGAAAQATKSAAQWVAEALNIETLGYDANTSAENESSVVLYGLIDNRKLLLTGDAGAQALSRAAGYAGLHGVGLDDLAFMQVPHHGSRRNVTPYVLNRVMGSLACASVAARSETHPRRVVTNAFLRRGARVYVTKGTAMRFPWNMGERYGYGPVDPVPFYEVVEG